MRNRKPFEWTNPRLYRLMQMRTRLIQGHDIAPREVQGWKEILQRFRKSGFTGTIDELQSRYLQEIIHQTFGDDGMDYSQKEQLFVRQSGECNGCRKAFSLKIFEMDHILARSKGGTDDIRNMQLLCPPCNKIKGRGTQRDLVQKLRDLGILRR